MEDVVNKKEALRILSAENQRRMQFRRYEFVCELHDAGKTMAEIGVVLDRHPTTIRKLLKRGLLERQKRSSSPV
jgi:IS30 family transposase